MAEAVGLASGLITLVSTALKVATYTSSALCSIANAPTHIAAVADEVSSFHSVMGTLQGLLDDAGIEQHQGGIVVTACLAGDLRREVGRAVGTLREIGTIAARRSGGVRVGGGDMVSSSRRGGGGSLWWKVRWAVTDEKEVERLRAVLASQKIIISLAIATANLVNTSSTKTSAERLEQDIAALKRTVTAILTRVESSMQPDHHLIGMVRTASSRSQKTIIKGSKAANSASIEVSDRPRSHQSDSSGFVYETARTSWEKENRSDSRLPFNTKMNDSHVTLNNSIFSFESADTLVDNDEASLPKTSDMGKVSVISKALDVISMAGLSTEQKSLAGSDKESMSLRRKWAVGPNKMKRFSWSAVTRRPSRRAGLASS